MENEYSEEMIKADMYAFYKDMREQDNKREESNKAALEFVKQNIDYDIDLIELEDISWQHEGYVEVEKSNYKNGFYPNHDFYTEKGEKVQYMRQDDEGTYHNMVYQTTGFLEDDFSGSMLFPLTNGKYWKISYYC